MARRPLDEEYIDIDDTFDGNQDDDAGKAGYAWEEEYKRSWDVLQEDEEGRLSSVVAQLQQQRKRRRLLKDTAVIQRGIIRHLFLIVDLSEAMNEKDLRPNRIDLTITYAKQFVIEYFDQNPISQLGIIVTRDGIAEKLTELSGNPNDHVRALDTRKNIETSGEPSLQNALQLARSSMVGVPSHGSKEILLVFGALTTCDPTDIHDTVNLLQRENVRVNIVGLAAEVQICRELCTKTKGTYGVVLNEAHYKDLMFDAIPPPAIAPTKNASNLVMMGFPRRHTENQATFCVCHSKLTTTGYICPRCGSKVCELPSDCDVCGLTLVSSPHLARSYHHLFPVENFDEIRSRVITKDDSFPSGCTDSNNLRAMHCFSCLVPFDKAETGATAGSGQYVCPKCRQEFCMDCDIFVHEVLHNCPGCWSIASKPQESHA
ncbi:Ssl1-like-domain-containing protein [Fennellomyces sp. T-0311]|nr:Ssl1-like-domain-containing protein [Fennellomyces sp. T-0311]